MIFQRLIRDYFLILGVGHFHEAAPFPENGKQLNHMKNNFASNTTDHYIIRVSIDVL